MVVVHASRRRKRLVSGEGDRKRWWARSGAWRGRATTHGAAGAPTIRASSRRQQRPGTVQIAPGLRRGSAGGFLFREGGPKLRPFKRPHTRVAHEDVFRWRAGLPAVGTLHV